MQCPPRRQAALTKCAARLDFPVPAVPETKILVPRKYPLPPSMVSKRGTPLETRSEEALCCKPTDVMGKTEMPSSSMRNGYSLVPCVLPRYLTICNLRVEICSRVRWSSKITQSETYSSN